MAVNRTSALEHLRVLVTRPTHQAETLCQLIETAGGHAVRLPVIEIAEPTNISTALDVIARIDHFDIAIFISANAVEKACSLIATWPTTLKIAAVGKSTRDALLEHGLSTDICPKQDFNSESLLALTELQQIQDKNIVIFRGEGGRETLAETLKQRGARVEYAEIYRRSRPDTDISSAIANKKPDEHDLIIVTSNAGLQNLYDMAAMKHRTWLLNTPLAVISPRNASFAKKLGFTSPIIIANEASDHGITDAIIRWHAENVKYWNSGEKPHEY